MSESKAPAGMESPFLAKGPAVPQVELEAWHKGKHTVYRVWVHVDIDRMVSSVHRYSGLRSLHCSLKKTVKSYGLHFPKKTLTPSSMLSAAQLRKRSHELDVWVQQAESIPEIVQSEAWCRFFHIPPGTLSHLFRKHADDLMAKKTALFDSAHHARPAHETTKAILALAHETSAMLPYASDSLPDAVASTVPALGVNRMGEIPDEFMVTDRISGAVLPGKKYHLSPRLGGRRVTLTEVDMEKELGGGDGGAAAAGAGAGDGDGDGKEADAAADGACAGGAAVAGASTPIPTNPHMCMRETQRSASVVERQARGVQPPQARFQARWMDPKDPTATDMLKAHAHIIGGSDSSNILGANGEMMVEPKGVDDGTTLEIKDGSDELTLHVPWVWATDEYLRYYGARLVDATLPFEFDTDKPLPVAHMRIGGGYVDGYIRRLDRGGGFYAEHHVTPHFHLPREKSSHGYVLFMKVEGEEEPEPTPENPQGLPMPRNEKQLYGVTAFRIPFGFAVYSGPRVIHNDSYLVGAYSVVYAVTEHFSTVMLKWDEDACKDGKHSGIGPVAVTVDTAVMSTEGAELKDSAGKLPLTASAKGSLEPHHLTLNVSHRLSDLDDGASDVSSVVSGMGTPMASRLSDIAEM